MPSPRIHHNVLHPVVHSPIAENGPVPGHIMPLMMLTPKPHKPAKVKPARPRQPRRFFHLSPDGGRVTGRLGRTGLPGSQSTALSLPTAE